MEVDTSPDVDGVPLAPAPDASPPGPSLAAPTDVEMLTTELAPTEPQLAISAPVEPISTPAEPSSAPALEPVVEAIQLEATSDPAPAPAALVAAPADPEAEVFKVPALPPTTGLNGLPSDIEHILSLGANEGDKDEQGDGLASTSNYEKVVKDLREKAGFAIREDGPAADKEVELESIEQEMAAGGVPRIKAEPEDVVKMDLTDTAGTPAAIPDDSSSSDSSDSSSSDSDSDIEPSRLIPASSVASTDATSDAGAAGPKRTRTRKRPQKKAANNDSDLSDDDVNNGPAGSAPKTEHELAVPEIALPTLQRLPDDVEIAVVGKIVSVIDTVVVVRASTAGDWRVLDEGTVCCWDDKTVVGAIFETFGSVQQPFYSLRFPATAVPDPAVFTVGRAVHYAPKMASFVFTRDIRNIKGSDASNIWDEEVGAAEMEWSDDEAEQEYKRSVKAERRSRTASATPGPSSRQNSRAPSASLSNLPPRPPPSGLPYDDDTYTPLQRPRDLHLMGDAPPPAAEGRRMFERDTGRNTRAGGPEVEFEFSDDDGSIDGGREPPSGRGGRGGARGRGEGRGRGRGGNDGAGRGRGRGRGDDAGRDRGAGRGRGERQGSDARTVAPLPRGLPRPAGLPARPDFVAEMPAEVQDEDRRRASVPDAAGTSMRSPPQTNSPAVPSTSAAPSAAFPPMAFGVNSPAPFYPSGPSSHSYSPAFGGQQQQGAYTPFNPAMGGGSGNFNFQQPYSAPQPYGGYPQGGYPTPPPFGGAPPSNPVAGGHFNPRFFGGNQPNQGSAAYPPHGQQPYGQGGYPGQQGYGNQPYMGQGQFPPQQQWGGGYPQGPGSGAPGPGPGPGGPTGPSGWQGQQGNGGR